MLFFSNVCLVHRLSNKCSVHHALLEAQKLEASDNGLTWHAPGPGNGLAWRAPGLGIRVVHQGCVWVACIRVVHQGYASGLCLGGMHQGYAAMPVWQAQAC